MTDEKMIELAERVERADGSDRELDISIARELGVAPLYQMRGMISGSWPDYTASLDAAMTLVPEGWRWTLFHEGVVSLKPDVAFCAHPEHRTNGIEKRGDGATPALALTAAALRALSQKDSHNE